MQIPSGVKHWDFYKAAKSKGIRISSRFQGVCVNEHGTPRKASWIARYQGGGKSVLIGRFPFSEEGEERARQAYLQYLEKNGLKERFAEKRKYKQNKKAKINL
jgi:hypothetical protein